MKYLLVYWAVGCVLIGLGLGARERRCPNDDLLGPAEVAISIAAWPAQLTWAMVSPGLPACKKAP